jgi:hypothetical protein
MTDIVERLRKWFKDVNAVSAIDLMDEAANEIERLRLRWIPVSERLPEHEDDVLLYVEDYGSWITLGRRSGDGWYVNEAAEGGGPKPLDRFTHWMPLPEPPEVT